MKKRRDFHNFIEFVIVLRLDRCNTTVRYWTWPSCSVVGRPVLALIRVESSMPPNGPGVGYCEFDVGSLFVDRGEAYCVERWSIARAGLGSHRLAERAHWTKGDLNGANVRVLSKGDPLPAIAPRIHSPEFISICYSLDQSRRVVNSFNKFCPQYDPTRRGL